ncbi:MAG: hypothetical protein MMC33_001938 [Icmadophila ericetorum]|nr:hypothetical protein [Icmadophila ericetorum]
MAAERSAADGRSNFEPSSPTTTLSPGSPSTVSPNCYKDTGAYDCEAATNGSVREKSNLDKCPKGYPNTAGFMSSDPNFGQYRGFNYLHSRVLLHLQNSLAVLERELDRKDGVDAGKICLQSIAKDKQQDKSKRSREIILTDIRKRLVEYDEILAKARELVSFQKPSNRDYNSVINWFSNVEPLVEKEQAFIRHREDLLTINTGREWCGFDGMIEKMLKKCDCWLIRRLFLTEELRKKTQASEIHYFDKKRVEKLVGIIITAIIFVLLILPVIGMYKLTEVGDAANPQSTFTAIGVLVVFTLLFSAAMSLLTKAQRHELFAASAAYCAVLVVFISNLNGSSFGGNAS